MKKTGKKLGFALATLLLAVIPMLNSCKKEAANITDLVNTVPSSSSAVVGLNLKALLEKAGCRVSGTEVKAGKEVERWLSTEKLTNASEKEAVKVFLSGESGVDPTGAVFFIDAYDAYVTAVLADTGKFKAFIEKQTGKKFEGSEVQTCGNVAVSGAQMWICVSGSTIDSKAVRNYSNLSSAQSFSTNALAPELSELRHDLVGWATTKSLSNRGTMGNRATMQLVESMLFDDAVATSFCVDFEKGKASAVANILNDKGEMAKYLLPADKVDTKLLDSLGATSNVYIMAAVPSGLVKKIDKIGSSLGGSMIAPFITALKGIDGTVALSFSDIDDSSKGFCGVATTDGNPSLDLMNLLGNFGTTRKEGKSVYFSHGVPSGGLDAAEGSSFFKGTTFGMLADVTGPEFSGKEIGLKTVGFAVKPKDGGVSLHIEAKGLDDGENMVLTVLKNLK